jgi:AcrR family transcriptional regulator
MSTLPPSSPRFKPRLTAVTVSAAPAVAAVELAQNAKTVGKLTGKAVAKGQQTKAAIVDAALGLATHIGLEGLSIGALAEVAKMSKSGVFAHFGSREELQISVIREYHTRFEEEVFFPAMAVKRGLPRVRALFKNWMARTSVEIDSGCIYISGAVEFDDRPGPVRDALALAQAQELGDLRADTDIEQLLFEIHGLILALHYDARFLKNAGSVARGQRGFDHILAPHIRRDKAQA